MSKLLYAALVSSAIALSPTVIINSASAGTCAGASCRPQPIQFNVGQRINIEVINLTSNLVQMEKVKDTDAFVLSPGQQVSLIKGGSTEPNLSLVFWDVNGLRLKVNVAQPEARTLRIEIRSGGQIPGDRSVYLRDDGRVAVF